MPEFTTFLRNSSYKRASFLVNIPDLIYLEEKVGYKPSLNYSSSELHRLTPLERGSTWWWKMLRSLRSVSSSPHPYYRCGSPHSWLVLTHTYSSGWAGPGPSQHCPCHPGTVPRCFSGMETLTAGTQSVVE